MRQDHIAYRVADRKKTAQFFIDAMGYKIQQEFTIDFGEGQTAQCIVLEPPEKQSAGVKWAVDVENFIDGKEINQEYHLPAEIFISDGSPGSIVGDWVAARGGIGGIHHIAFQVDSVEEKMKEWKEKGYAEFTTDEPMKCEGLTQVFTKPSSLTNVIYEFIERTEFGFCAANVKDLMNSTKNI